MDKFFKLLNTNGLSVVFHKSVSSKYSCCISQGLKNKRMMMEKERNDRFFSKGKELLSECHSINWTFKCNVISSFLLEFLNQILDLYMVHC